MRLLRASLLKLVRRPASGRALLVLAVLLTLIYLSIGMSAGTAEARASVEPMLAFPSAYAALAGMLLMFAGIVGAAYAGAVAASEWSWSTFRTALARGESRAGYVSGLFVAIAVLTLVGWFAVYALGIGVILVASSLAGVPAGDPFSPTSLAAVPALIAGGGWAVLMLTGLGFGVSFISRSAVAGVATVMGLVFIEQFAAVTSIPADLLRLAPITAASSVVSTAGGTGAGIGLPLAVTTAYLVLSIVIAAAAGRRAQVA
jgi:hypothetical protein